MLECDVRILQTIYIHTYVAYQPYDNDDVTGEQSLDVAKLPYKSCEFNSVSTSIVRIDKSSYS